MILGIYKYHLITKIVVHLQGSAATRHYGAGVLVPFLGTFDDDDFFLLIYELALV